MDDLGGFIVGLLAFFLLAYVLITVLAYLMIAATVGVPAFFLIRHLAIQLRDRYTVTGWARAGLILNAGISLVIGLLLAGVNNLSGFWSLVIAVAVWLVTTPALLGLWAQTVLRPYETMLQEAESALVRSRTALQSLDRETTSVQNEIKEIEARHAAKMRRCESLQDKVDRLCLNSGNDHRFRMVARNKLEARIASLSTPEIEKRLEAFRKPASGPTIMERLERGLLEIALLERQTEAGTLKDRHEDLQSLEKETSRLRRQCQRQEEDVQQAKQALDALRTQKIVLGERS